ncbi:SDR family oxidoreductase [Sphingobium cloacae]|uniref:Short-chain dehydrogenase n=1 Tax=Sphingobium cloacae TaxID=120107 RepID=A0A1E1F1N4_9SPHN|nr:SDR family oxidoreductase [Sphingobium cloacae]BAV64433.1 short-chain dehydrogenase [Sphingobium cloacae]
MMAIPAEQPMVAIITGGSGGIGSAIARVLARKSATVVLTARQAERLEEAAETIRKATSGLVCAIPSNATSQDTIDQLVEGVVERFGRIDLLVNCAASTSSVAGDVAELDVQALLGDLDTKVCGYLRYIRAVAPVMKRQGAGRIVNIGGLTGRGSDTLSGMRNVAVSHMTKVLSDALGPDGITVNAIHPGIVQTPHLEELLAEIAEEEGGTVAEAEADFISRIPIRRVTDAEEIGEVIAFLASPGAASITGEAIAIDGGYSRGVYL